LWNRRTDEQKNKEQMNGGGESRISNTEHRIQNIEHGTPNIEQKDALFKRGKAGNVFLRGAF